MRGLIKRFDNWLCDRYGIFTFCQERDCILKLQYTLAPHPFQSGGSAIAKGDPVLELHLWNEHLPIVPPGGADMVWATKTLRLFRYSLSLAAHYAREDSRFQPVHAVVGVTTILNPPDGSNTSHPMERFGFKVTRYRSPLGRFGEFWENFYAWWLVWAYNPPSARQRDLFIARRSEIWMAAQDFIGRYGKER
jgi:hypothetical protein